MKSTKEIIYGIELEGVYNSDNFIISGSGSLNDATGARIPNMDIKHDGSINDRGEYKRTVCAEVVNRKPLTKRGLMSFLKLFREGIGGKNKELKECVSFNYSCGCHFHFSKEGVSLVNSCSFESIKAMRGQFYKLIMDAKTLNEEEKDEIIRKYNRKYARKNTLPKRFYWKNYYTDEHGIDYKGNNHGKYSEFNFNSEIEDRGLEWRSPNLFNIKRWEQFDELIKIYISCIEFLYRYVAEGQKHKYTIRPFKDSWFIAQVRELKRITPLKNMYEITILANELKGNETEVSQMFKHTIIINEELPNV